MRAIGLVAVAAALLVTGTRPARPAAGPSPAGEEPVPEGATLSVSTGKAEVLLGERVVLRLRLANGGPLPFTIVPTTYSVGASRDECVSVSLVDADGRPAWDPFPERRGGGGPEADAVTLARGESWEESVDLWRYGIPDHAGTWKVRVSRLFGWRETTARPNPSADRTLSFREPTGEEAKRVLEALAAEGKGGRSRLYAAAYPVFVPLLEERGASGDPDAANGLALDRDLAATRALLRLFASKERAVARRAGEVLAWRVVAPVLVGETGDRIRLRPLQDGPLKAEEMAGSWRAEFAPEALAAARAFLAGEGDPPVGPAGAYLGGFGTAEDGPLVSGVLERVSLLFERDGKHAPGEEAERLDHLETEVEGIEAAASELKFRGLTAPADPQTAADALLWIWSDRSPGAARPAGWMEILERLASHPRALVRREVARLCRHSGSADPLFRRLALRLQGDGDARVREAAGKER